MGVTRPMPLFRSLRAVVALSMVSTAALFAAPAVALADCMAPPAFDEAVRTNAASSVDRAFEVGQRYVFFPYFGLLARGRSD